MVIGGLVDNGAESVVSWTVEGAGPSLIESDSRVNLGDETSGSRTENQVSSGQVSFVSADGTLRRDIGTTQAPGQVTALGPSSFAWNDTPRNGCVLEDAATGVVTALDFCANAIAADGAVAGGQEASPDRRAAPDRRHRDGAAHRSRIHRRTPRRGKQHPVSGGRRFGAGEREHLPSPGLVLEGVEAMSNNGILVGPATDASNTEHGFMLSPDVSTTTALACAGSRPACSPAPRGLPLAAARPRRGRSLSRRQAAR